jgi:ribose transport system substrate-binding protein
MNLKLHDFVGGAAIALALLLSPLAASADPTAAMKAQEALMSAKPQGPADKPWEQRLNTTTVDTTKYKKPGPYRVCFSNASVSNPWRVEGWTTMQAAADLMKADIKSLEYADAQDKDDKQISDIRAFVSGGKCDILIVSPHTSDALTPVVEEACKSLPVITFDRSVNSKCPVTAVHSIGGYAYGIAGAKFVVDNMPKGGKLLVLRTAPGIDVFETRSDAALQVFKDDFGAMSVAVAEAFEDAGQPYPVITGEDQNDYLQKWQKDGFKGIAPTYPAYQWRTALIAAVDVLKGEPVPGPEWVLPQPVITKETLANYVDPKMPALFYAACGCSDLPGYPTKWGGKK